jgi:hypothetical protein
MLDRCAGKSSEKKLAGIFDLRSGIDARCEPIKKANLLGRKRRGPRKRSSQRNPLAFFVRRRTPPMRAEWCRIWQ